MSNAVKSPKTLLEAVTHFSDEKRAFEAIRDRRWPNGVTCPRCGSEKVGFVESNQKNKSGSVTVRRLWNCSGCHEQFTAKTCSIFEDSPIPFSKWLPAMWLIANSKNGISSCELAKGIGVNQRSAWFMLHRIRLAMQNGTFEKVGGHIEADETYIGGKSINMHKFERERKITGTGGQNKVIVMGFLERGGSVRTLIIHHNDTKTINRHVKDNVERGSFLYTDSLASYRGMTDLYHHFVIDHAQAYVKDFSHTNGMENYWALLKRTLKGTYISVEPFHLSAYLDEQAFRFNERKLTDSERFELLATQIAGKRLTYKALIGKELAAG